MDEQLWFGKYRPVQLLAATDVTEVFLVIHNGLGEKRVMKRVEKIHPECSNLRKEAIYLQKVKHPNIPIVYDMEEDEKYMYIIEEYIQGLSLAKYRKEHGPFTFEQVVMYGISLCGLLGFLHEDRKMLYLDLSPGNVIIAGDELKLIDFGTSECMNNIQDKQQRYGTPGFAAPEAKTLQAPDERADIYALGQLLLFMYDQHSTVDKELMRILSKCTEEHESRRFRYIGEVRDKLVQLNNKKRKFFGKSKTSGNGTVQKGVLSIGLIGSHRGAGTTHTAILMANILHQVYRKKVVVAECNEHQDLQFLIENNTVEDCFLLMGVTYFPDFLLKNTEPLHNGTYDCCIYDFGSEYEENKQFLMRCDMKFIVTDCSPWHIKKNGLLLDLDQEITCWKNWQLLINHALPKDYRFFRHVPMKTMAIPHAPDPFRITRPVVKCFNFFDGTA